MHDTFIYVASFLSKTMETMTKDAPDQLELLKRRLDIMEWDLKRDQLSPAMRAKFDKLKQEYQQKKREQESEQ